MDRLKQYILIVFFLFTAGVSFGEREKIPGIVIDWLKMELRVTGMGAIIPKDGGNEVEWQFDAVKIAGMDLLKKFIGSMSILRVDAYNTAHNILKANYSKNEDLYSYSEAMRNRTVKYDDSSVFITKTFSFYGKEGFVPLLLRSGEDTGNFHRYDEYVHSIPFTGLVVDARGLNRVPAIAPRIFDEDHNLIYSADLMEKESFDTWGAVQYTDDPLYRGFEERVGKNPYKIVAVRNDKLIETDIAIFNENARVLLQNEATGRSLKEGRVIIVIDSF